LTLEQDGQGTLTAATVRAPAATPLPLHFTVTLIASPQVQQAKSNITWSSIIEQQTSRISEVNYPGLSSCQG
jgi:hypothetical protein